IGFGGSTLQADVKHRRQGIQHAVALAKHCVGAVMGVVLLEIVLQAAQFGLSRILRPYAPIAIVGVNGVSAHPVAEGTGADQIDVALSFNADAIRRRSHGLETIKRQQSQIAVDGANEDVSVAAYAGVAYP